MAALVSAITSVAAMPAWQEEMLADAPDTARHTTGSRGVFFGYDFHAAGDNVGLIEINTNAGGALLNAVVRAPIAPAARKSRNWCRHPPRPTASKTPSSRCSARSGGCSAKRPAPATAVRRPLSSIAIVDDAPEEQYLYPEFLMFRRLLSAMASRR